MCQAFVAASSVLGCNLFLNIDNSKLIVLRASTAGHRQQQLWQKAVYFQGKGQGHSTLHTSPVLMNPILWEHFEEIQILH